MSSTKLEVRNSLNHDKLVQVCCASTERKHQESTATPPLTHSMVVRWKTLVNHLSCKTRQGACKLPCSTRCSTGAQFPHEDSSRQKRKFVAKEYILNYFLVFLACFTRFSTTPSNASLSPSFSSVLLVQ